MNITSKSYFYKFRFLKILSTLLSTQYSLMLEYRAEIALWAISGVLPLIMLSLWIQTDYEILGIPNREILIRYFISAFVVRQFTAVWVMVTFEEDNLEGRLSPYLLQPVHPFWRYLTSHLAEQLTRIPFVFIMLVLLFLFIPDSLWIPDINSLIFGFMAIFFAFIVRFLLHWIFAMLCFWNDRASSIERLLLIPHLFLSGLVAPLDTYPGYVKLIAYSTPFPYFLSFPAKILAGQTSDFISGFIILFIWFLLLLLISYISWRTGVKKYSAMGA